MLETDLTGMTVKELRSIARLAFHDRDEANDFAMAIYRQKLMASEGLG